MKFYIAAIIWLTSLSFVSAQFQLSLQSLFKLGLRGDRESVISFIEAIEMRSKSSLATGKVDSEYLDMLYSLRNIPDEKVKLSYDEYLWSRQHLVVSELAKSTNYAKTLPWPVPTDDDSPTIDTFAVQIMNADGREKFLIWYRDDFRAGEDIMIFKTPRSQTENKK